MNVGEAIVTITGDTKKLDQSLKDSQNKVKSSADKMKKALLPVGLAFTAVGAAGLKMVDSARKMNAQLGVTAKNLGISTKEMRSLALETTNVTFPLKEVTATFDLLARAGVKDQKVLAATATAFDTLGDATGRSASQVTAMMIPAMKTFGLSAEEMAEKTDIMTYMSRESTMTMEDFNTMVGYTTPELVKAGLTMDDLTAALIHMEREGYAPGRVMTREFMKATTLATKEQIPLTEALGMTSEELEEIQKELAGATGMTQEYADIANEQYGVMDKVRQKFDELVLSAGTFLEPLEPLLAGMTALGPLMIALSTSAGTAAVKWGLHTIALVAHKVALFASAIAIKAVTAAQWLWNAAMTANPIGLIIVGIGALIAAGVALWKNWDKVSDFFEKLWANMRIIFGQAVKYLVSTVLQPFLLYIDKFLGSILRGVANVVGIFNKDWAKAINNVADTMQNLDKEITDWADNLIESGERSKEALARTGDAFEEMGGNAVNVLGEVEEGLEDVAEASELTTDEMIENLERLTEEAKDKARERTRAELDAIDERVAAERDAHREKMDNLRDEYDATMKTIDAELSAELGAYQDAIDLINQELRAEEDAERDRRRTEEKTEIETRIAEERDAEKRIALERRLNELILESGNETWQTERKLALEAKIEDAKDAEERARLEKQLSSQLIALEIERRNEERRLALEARIATETDAEERVRLEKELADFLEEIQISQAEAEAAFREEARIAEAEAAGERKALEDELASYLIELQAEQTKMELKLRREALEEKMDMAREEAEDAKDKAQEAYDKKSELWEQEHEALIDQLEEQKADLDEALAETLQRYDDDLEAFKNMTAAELVDIKSFVKKYNDALDKLEDKTVTIITEHIDIYKKIKEEDIPTPPTPPSEEILPPWEPGEPEPPAPPTPPSEEIIDKKDWEEELKDITPGIRRGGIAMRPILARIAEREPEAVIPLDRLGTVLGGYRTANIYVMLNERVLAEVLEQRLVDDIRLRTGAHL